VRGARRSPWPSRPVASPVDAWCSASGDGTVWPSYCHDRLSYSRFSGSNPENTPAASSVSRKSPSMMVATLEYARTYSLNQRSFDRM
jgi:hypothetical protein